MKILRLRLCNLASLAGEQEIDFEAEPLAHAGLIAITGKTGAGKSTLLDAMCLALFDQIPRLNGAAGSIEDISGQSISIRDSKQILRRGTTQGFADVEFLALDQKRYLAHWEIRRARNKIDGNLKVDRAITCLDDGRVLTQKISECTPTVQNLIGLSFEQFTRAVLLAQSEVGAFLKAKDQERADLLEYLTNSNIFSLISQLSFEKTKQFRDELTQLGQVLGHIELLSPEQVDNLEQHKKALIEQIQQRQLEQKQFEQVEHWYQRQNDLHKQLEQKQQQLADHQTQQQHIDTQRNFIKHLDQFNEIRSTFNTQDKAQQQYKQTVEQKQMIQPIFTKITADFANAKQQLEILTQHVTQKKKQISDLQPALQQALAYDAKRLHLLEQYQDKQQEVKAHTLLLDRQNTQIDAIKLQLQQLEQQQTHTLAQLEQSCDIAVFSQEPKATFEKIDAFLQHWHTLEQYRQNFNDFDVNSCVQAQNDLTEQITQLQQKFGNIEQIEQHLQQQQNLLHTQQQQHHAAQTFQRSLKHYQDLSTQYAELDQNIHTLQQAIQQYTQQYTLAEQTYKQAEQYLKQVQQVLLEQRLLQAEHIENLRTALKPEQPCMVCGSLQHPFVEHADTLKQALTQIQDSQEQYALDAREQAQLDVEHAQRQLIQHQSSLNDRQQHITMLNAQLDAARQQLQYDLPATGFSFKLDQNTSDIQHVFVEAFNLLQNSLEQQQHNVQHWQRIIKQVKDLHIKQQQQQQLLERIQHYQQAEQPICSQLNPAWAQRWQAQPQHTAQQLKQEIEQRIALQQNADQQQQQKQQLEHQLYPLQEKQKDLQQQLQIFRQKLEQIKNDGQNNSDALLQLLQQHGEKTFKTGQAWQDGLALQLQQVEQQYEHAKQQYQHIEQQLQQQQTQLAQLDSQLEVWHKQIQESEENKQSWRQLHPHFNDKLIQQCLAISTQESQHLRDSILSFDQQFTELNSNITVYKNELNAHQQQQPSIDWQDLQQHIQEHSLALQTLIEQRDEINAKLISNAETSKTQQQYQQQIEQLQQQVNRWGKISELIGHSKGEKFQRIAQEHHLDILVEYANQQLEPLTPRYRLQRIPNSLGLSVIDYDMDAEQRSVLSLSGGETFLVSLALALAIANMASGSMKLDSLFIDEGFGTLDPTSLHIVMDALDRLQSQGRKVVLISHVQEMHERIPIQIQVGATGAGASTIQIIG